MRRYVIVKAAEPDPAAPPVVADTQVVSYAMKGVPGFSAENVVISSTVAHEFLNVRDRLSGKPRYFLPCSRSVADMAPMAAHDSRGGRPRFRNTSDLLLMDFNNEHPSVAEYSHNGMSQMINTGAIGVFSVAVSHLPDSQARKLVDRFEFLVSMRVNCRPIQGRHVEGGYELFREHMGKERAKDDFRNSLNDMLILSFALDTTSNGGIFETRDKLLAEIAARYFDKRVERGPLIRLTRSPTTTTRKVSRESKGYINTGWRFQFR
ncbi:hypothetical protein ACFU5Z_22525 [Streptomyces sp. NPDC057521]|uniref:hypothetical protein n=1 Tax=Streptomyces sp. NPDC057521 TaxID=3346156 RepID=UPI003693CCE7